MTTDQIAVPSVDDVVDLGDDPMSELSLKGVPLNKVWERAQQFIKMSDDFAHELWTGPSRSSVPCVSYDSQSFSLRQVAWAVHHLTSDPPQKLYHDTTVCDHDRCITHLTTVAPRYQKKADTDTFTINDAEYYRSRAEDYLDRATVAIGDCIIATTNRLNVYGPGDSTSCIAASKLAYGLATDDDAQIPYHLGTTCGQPSCVKFEHLADRHSDAVKNAPDVEEYNIADVVDQMELPVTIRPVFAATWRQHGGDIGKFREYIARANYWCIAGKELK